MVMGPDPRKERQVGRSFHYRAVNPAYGTMRDFRRFVAEAHKRGIRVIIELVINHTSDQHHWCTQQPQ